MCDRSRQGSSKCCFSQTPKATDPCSWKPGRSRTKITTPTLLSGGRRHCHGQGLFARPLTTRPDSWPFGAAICQVEHRMEGGSAVLSSRHCSWSHTHCGSFLIITHHLSSSPSQLPVGCLPNREFNRDGCVFCVCSLEQKVRRACENVSRTF